MLDKVVVGVDGSDASRAAVQWCASHLEPGTTVVAVCGTIDLASISVEFMSAAWYLHMASTEQALKEYWCQPLRRAGLRCDCRLVYGSQAAALCEIASQEHADALVVGKPSHRAAIDALLGGTVRKVIHRPPCPLIVVPSSAPTPQMATRRVVGDGRPADDGDASAGSACPASGEPQVWSPCRIVLVTRSDEVLVLDCLIPPSTIDDAGNATGSDVPITLQVFLPEEVTTKKAEETLRSWADTNSPLEITCSRQNRLPLVQVAQLGSDISVRLEQAALPH